MMARPNGASTTAAGRLLLLFPDGKRVIFTSTRDHTDMPIGNWSDQNNYPQGAELYVADIDGKNRKRLTNNMYYEAEVSISPMARRSCSPQSRAARPLHDEHRRQRREEAHRYAGLAGGCAVLPAGLEDHHHRAWSARSTHQAPDPMTIFTITPRLASASSAPTTTG